MAGPQENSLVLRGRLESLPQELYDIIYDLTFTAKPGFRQLGTALETFEHVTPPADPYPTLLRIDRRSRAKFAESYYGEGATFVIYDEFSLKLWLGSISKFHRALMVDIRCVLLRATPADEDLLHAQEASWQPIWNMSLAHIADDGGFRDEGVFQRIQLGYETKLTQDLEVYTSIPLEEAKQGRRWQDLKRE